MSTGAVGTGPSPSGSFDGAVLAGGASRRMGRDKAMVRAPDGRPLVRVAVDGLTAAGADRVVVVGGDRAAIEGLGLAWVPDRHPGEGPLGGIVTALHASTASVVVVVACDMPGFGAEVPAALVAALGGAPTAGLAVATLAEREQPLTAAWRRERALPVLEQAFAAGRRAPRLVIDELDPLRVVGLAPHQLDDVDSPEDLRRYADRHPSWPTRTGSP